VSLAPADSALAGRLAERQLRRIAVIQTAFLGDTVFSSALVAGLAARFPNVGITLVVTPRGRDVARSMPHVDDVLVYDKRRADRGIPGFLRLAKELRARSAGLAVLPHRSLRSALLAWRAGISERLGFLQASGSLFYTAKVHDPGGAFLIREGALLSVLGAAPGPMRLSTQEPDRAAAKERLRKLREGVVGTPTTSRLIGLALGSEWETKIWPVAKTAELARRLANRGFTPVLLGGPREKAIAAEILRACPRALDTTGNPIGEALAILEQTALCVGGDSGLAHAARALSVPSLLLFGPTDPALHQLGSRARALSLHLDCSPCGPHGAHRCPLGHHRCLRDLSVEHVEEAALALLGDVSPARTPLDDGVR
jgi:heptosyltransferase-2